MKRIHITESQLIKAIQRLNEDDKINIQMPGNLSELNPTEKRQTVDKLKQVAKNDSRVELTVPVDPNKADVNKIDGVMKEEIGEGNDLFSQIINAVREKYPDIDNDEYDEGEIRKAIVDAYMDVTGMPMTDRMLFHKIRNMLHGNTYNESVVLTKKQIKEMKANKRIAESVKVITKKGLLDSLK